MNSQPQKSLRAARQTLWPVDCESTSPIIPTEDYGWPTSWKRGCEHSGGQGHHVHPLQRGCRHVTLHKAGTWATLTRFVRNNDPMHEW